MQHLVVNICIKLNNFFLYSKEMLSATLAKHIQYINSHKDEKKLHVLTVWAIVDLESPKGREIGKSMF